MTSQMMSKEHSVEDFLESHRLQDDIKSSTDDGTLARLVSRFRNEPAQPRKSRTDKNIQQDFWWLHSSPSRESTPLSDEIFSPGTPKITPTTVDHTPSSEDTGRNIDFRAKRLLELTDSTISSNDDTVIQSDVKKERNKSSSESNWSNRPFPQTTNYKDERSFVNNNRHSHNINNPWSHDNSNTQTDILQQWRLARKMEMARKTNQPNAFLERTNISKIIKSKTRNNAEDDSQFTAKFGVTNNKENVQRTDTRIKDLEISVEKIVKNSRRNINTSNKQCKFPTNVESNVTSRQDDEDSDVFKFQPELNKSKCRCPDNKEFENINDKFHTQHCLFCFNNQLAFQTPHEHNISYYQPHYHVPPHVHKTCDIIPCAHVSQNSNPQPELKVKQQREKQTCVCNNSVIGEHIPSINKLSDNESDKNSPTSILTSSNNIKSRRNDFDEKRKKKTRLINKKKSVEIEKKNETVTKEQKLNKNTSEEDISKKLLRPVFEEIVADYVFNQDEDKVSVKETQASKFSTKKSEGTGVCHDRDVIDHVSCNSPVAEFDDDEVLQDLRKRRNILLERLRKIEMVLQDGNSV